MFIRAVDKSALFVLALSLGTILFPSRELLQFNPISALVFTLYIALEKSVCFFPAKYNEVFTANK